MTDKGTTAITGQLSKSRYVAGLQCPKMLWWKVNEPGAPELTPDAGQQKIFDRGHRVGELARAHIPGGVLIDIPYHEGADRVAATRKAMSEGAPAIYEATFIEDEVFVSIDILKRQRDGFALIEVKSTLDVKDKHIPDVAIQFHVARKAGVAVTRAEVMHLNRACRHPDLSNLFVRRAVTRRIQPWLRAAAGNVRAFHKMVAGKIPDVATGPHCTEPYDCPFMARCWPELPEHHVSTLYRIGGKKVAKLAADGITMIRDLPEDFSATGPSERQIRSVREGRTVVEPGLGRDLAALKPPLAFLDFETIAPAVPVWPGCKPYQGIPVQFSCHVSTPDGLAHHAWIADGPSDPRDDCARALVDACKGAKTIVAYNAPFEAGCIESLANALPARAVALRKLVPRLRDLLPIVRDNVYHPDFGGGFGIKAVLPALVPGLGYDDLEIGDGVTASAALESLLFESDRLDPEDRASLRRNLLAYCERDTLAMVRLVESLEKLAGE